MTLTIQNVIDLNNLLVNQDNQRRRSFSVEINGQEVETRVNPWNNRMQVRIDAKLIMGIDIFELTSETIASIIKVIDSRLNND